MCYNGIVPGVREQTVVPVFLGTIPGQAGKGDTMEDLMTKEEFKTVMQLVRQLIARSESIEEALKQFDELEVMKEIQDKKEQP